MNSIYFNSGSDVYKDFNGYLQLLGSHTEEFVICASLSSTNVSLIPVNTQLQFIVAPIPSSSTEITDRLSRCEMLIQSFDKQIRRLLISSHDISTHRSRSKSQSTMHGKRSSNVDRQQENQTALANDVFDSELSTEKKRHNFNKHRAISMVSIQFQKPH
jgi:ABC-type cobalamin transport system ATPase subunit